jgi:hypothetical protein
VTRRGALALVILALGLSACGGQVEEGAFRAGQAPVCSQPNEHMILLAQTVQTSTRLPCITGYPAGWSYAGDDLRNGSATFWLSAVAASPTSMVHTIEVQLVPSCERTGDPFIVRDATGIVGYRTTGPDGETRRYVYRGGCVIETVALPKGTDPLLIDQADGILGFVSREALAAQLERENDVVLCGVGAAPCAGTSSP